MSTYVPTDWVDGVTPVNAANLDKIEAGIVAVQTRIAAEEAEPNIPTPLPNGKWLTVAGGALVWADAPAGGSSIEYENAWAAGTPYTPGDVVIHNGVEYIAVNPSTGQTPPPVAGVSGATVVGMGTALPSSPFDGQEFILVDSLTAPTWQWRFRYVAAKASNKWIFIGGNDIRVFDASSYAINGSNQGYGPILTPPLTGQYLCRYLSYVSATLTHRWQTFPAGTAVAGTRVSSIPGTVEQVLALTAGDGMVGGVSGNATSADRQLTMLPVAVGG